MAPTSVPLFSALLSIVATIVALTMHAETWRPTPLYAASDRPKFPFGGKRREPEPVEEGPGLLDEVAGGRYGGGEASLPTAPPAGSAAPTPSPYHGEDDVRHGADGASIDSTGYGTGYDGGYDDSIMWAPSAGGEATLSPAPPPPPSTPLPGDPGWPREMGLLEAIANMPEQTGWDQPRAGRSTPAAGIPASPPLPLGAEPVPPFADLAPTQAWEAPPATPAWDAPPPPAAPAWDGPPPPAPQAWETPAAPATPATPTWAAAASVTPQPSHDPTMGPPADDPDSWHSWQWQTTVTPEDDPLPSPENVSFADVEARRAAAWDAAERGLDPNAFAMPASPEPSSEPRPSIWAVPAAPVADAWMTPPVPSSLPAPVADAWDAAPPPPPPPPPPFTTAPVDAASVESPPPSPPLSAPPAVAPLEATWDVAPRVEMPAPAPWDAAPSPSDAGLEPLSALWEVRVTDAAVAPADERAPEAWHDRAEDQPAPGFSFAATTTVGHPVIADQPSTDAARATDEWEALRGAFAGPEDDNPPAPFDAIEDIDDEDADGDTIDPRPAALDLDVDRDGVFDRDHALDHRADQDTPASSTGRDVPDDLPESAPVAARTASVHDDPWWGAASLDEHDPFAVALPDSAVTDAAADAAGTGFTSSSTSAVEDGADLDPYDADGLVQYGDAADPWSDTLIDRLQAVVGGQPPAREAATAPIVADAHEPEPAPAALHDAPVSAPALATEPSFEARVARGLRLRLTDDEVVSFLAEAIHRIAPEADVQVLAAGADVALDRIATAGRGERGGCGVARADRCPAIVEGESLSFADSTDLDACPHLAARGGVACAAVCVPLRSGVGVVHLTTDQQAPLGPDVVLTIETAATQSAARLTELRAG